ncbi:MAG TPA: hypothetical protein VNW54_14055 [Granulicella sp.]|jgi:outer membrane immunogenic protein|nr:hypothetical protein [Granulicella sp.]
MTRQMRKSIAKAVLLGVVFSAVVVARAQQRSLAGQMDLGITYAAGHSNFVSNPSFWMQGGSVELVGHVNYGLAAVADITGFHAGGGASGVPVNLVTDTFGPRYTVSIAPKGRKHPIALFGQGLIGEAHGFKGLYPGASGATTSALGFALQLGGGADIAVSRHISIRAVQAGWLRTQLPNSTTNVQSDFRIATGIVLHTTRHE